MDIQRCPLEEVVKKDNYAQILITKELSVKQQTMMNLCNILREIQSVPLCKIDVL